MTTPNTQLWEVFIRSRNGLAHKHVGSLHAADATLALQAARDAHLVTTDVWTSMGFEAENEARKKRFAGWQVGARLMRAARKDALFMHCLPAHRGEEVTDEEIDGPQSVVFDEAENRLHAQKGILAWCLNAIG